MVHSYSKIAVTDETLLPRLPKVDLETIDILDAPADGRQFPLPAPRDLDALLLSEARQMHDLGGLTLPEFVLLNDLEPLGPDAPDAHDQSLRIDETQWFDLFKRGQWLKFNHRVKGQNFMWDPADDRIWNILRPILELTTRMLRVAVHHKWLYSITDEKSLDRVHDVEVRGPHVHTDARKKGTISRFLPLMNGNPTRVMDFLKELSDHCLFSFDDDDSWARTCSGLKEEDGRYFSLVLFSIKGFEVFFDPNATKEEKDQTSMVLAITACHETMHAVSARMTEKHRTRLGLTVNAYTPWSACYESDMWYDDEPWTECGRSFTLDFFGSDPQMVPECDGIKLGPTSFIARGKPSPPYLRTSTCFYGRKEDDFKKLIVNSKSHRLMPILWSKAFFREDFWTWVESSGPRGIQVPLLGQQQEWQHYYRWDRTWRAYLDRDADVNAPSAIALQLRRITDNIIKHRRTVHALRHSWYRDALARWQATPYADVMRRSLVETMRKAFCNHTLQGERQAFVLVRKVTCDSNTLTNADNFYPALAQVALAATPVRYEPLLIEPERPETLALADVWQRTSHTPRLETLRNFRWKEPGLRILDEDYRSTLNNNGVDAVFLHEQLVEGEGTPSHLPIDCLDDALIEFYGWALAAPQPLGLATEFHRAWRSVFVSIERTALADVWHEFDFVMPPYQDVLSQAFDMDNFYGTDEFSITEDPLESPFPEERLPVANMVRPMEIPEWTRYVTIGEVGDHQYVKEGEAVPYWGLRWSSDHTEVLVYDISEIVAGLPENMTVMDILDSPKDDMPEMGLMIREELPAPYADRVNELEPISRVVISRQREDVFINDGRDERQRWIIMGPNVYDVTYALDSLTDIRDISNSLQKTTGIHPGFQLQDRYGIPPTAIVKQLADHKIGYLRDEFYYKSTAVDRFFTRRDLAWHADEECGYYVAIEGVVYDVTEYRHIHPGGEWALERIAGRDITDIWNRAHSTHYHAYEWLKNLRVGKMVNEHTEKTVVSTVQISIGKYIFNLLPIITSTHDENLTKWADISRPYRGNSVTDMDTILSNGGPEATKLYEMQAALLDAKFKLRSEIIVSKREALIENLPLFSKETLARYDGRRRNLETGEEHLDSDEVYRLDQFKEGFVAIDNLVYNVRSLRYSDRLTLDQQQALSHNMGRVLSHYDPDLAMLIRTEHDHRIVGRYVRNAEGNPITKMEKLRPPERLRLQLNHPNYPEDWAPIDGFDIKPLETVDRTTILVAPIIEPMETDEDSTLPPKKKQKLTDVEDPPRSPRVQGIRGHVPVGPGSLPQFMDLDPMTTSPSAGRGPWTGVDWRGALTPAPGSEWPYNPAMFTGYGAPPATGRGTRGPHPTIQGMRDIRGRHPARRLFNQGSGVRGGAATIGNASGGNAGLGTASGSGAGPAGIARPGNARPPPGPSPKPGEKRPRNDSQSPGS